LWWLITGETLDSGPSRDKNQNLTREEALISYTQGSAWFSLDEDSRGTLEVGKLADFAILSDDFFEVEESEIPEIRSLMTVVNGEIVFEVAK
jgi:predicted amidohydrolase YtcJ